MATPISFGDKLGGGSLGGISPGLIAAGTLGAGPVGGIIQDVNEVIAKFLGEKFPTTASKVTKFSKRVLGAAAKIDKTAAAALAKSLEDIPIDQRKGTQARGLLADIARKLRELAGGAKGKAAGAALNKLTGVSLAGKLGRLAPGAALLGLAAAELIPFAASLTPTGRAQAEERAIRQEIKELPTADQLAKNELLEALRRRHVLQEASGPGGAAALRALSGAGGGRQGPAGAIQF